MHGFVATGTMGEAAGLSREERRTVVAPWSSSQRPRPGHRRGVLRLRPAVARYAADAKAAGADAIMSLPPLGYRADPDEIVAFFSAAVHVRPPAHGLQQPRGLGRGPAAGLIVRIAREVEGVAAIKECSGDARRLAALITPASALEVLVGGDDWALEGFCAGATGWVTGVGVVAPREVVELYDPCRSGDLDAARDVYRRILPVARFDMTPKLVQYFKAAQDAVGFAGGPTRPPRLPLNADGAAALEDALSVLRERPRVRAARYFAAVDSHTEGMPTRVVTGGVGPIPGATMLERKLHFETEMDELRLLLMREPRGHGAMSGAILQPPTRADADWGVLFIEVSGCLPMCGHGTIGVATVLVETGMVAVTEPETVVRLDVPAGLVEARVQVEHGRARAVTLRNVPSFLHARDRTVDVAGLGEIAYDMAYGGNFYALTPAADAGLAVDPARSAELIDAGLRVMAAINAADRPEHPEDPRIAGCRHVVFHAPAATAPTPARPPRSTRAGSTARPAARARAPASPSCTPAARWRSTTPFVNESVIGTRFTGRAGGGDDRGGQPAVIPEITGPRLDHRDGPVPAGRRRPVSRRLSSSHRLDPAHQRVEAELEPLVPRPRRQRPGQRDEVREALRRQRPEERLQLLDEVRRRRPWRCAGSPRTPSRWRTAAGCPPRRRRPGPGSRRPAARRASPPSPSARSARSGSCPGSPAPDRDGRRTSAGCRGSGP